MNEDSIKKYYSQIDDFNLIDSAYNIIGLKNNAINYIVEEINLRGLDKNLIIGIEAQINGISEKEFTELKKLIKLQDCPNCKSKGKELKATKVGEVDSILVISNYEKHIRIGCETCLKKLNRNGLIKSIILGWWSIPYGPINTIKSVKFNLMMMNAKNDSILNSFIDKNIGFLVVNKKNVKKIRTLLKRNYTI